MELGTIKEKLREIVPKYRYAILIALIGIVLMVIPTKHDDTDKQQIIPEPVEIETVESKLADILSLVDGAGETRVFLTVLSGEETIYQLDEQISTGSDSSETKVTTITITDHEKGEHGLVRQVISPTYLGAIVVCRGGGQPGVRLAIVDAVSKVTGLGADQISVLKMK